MISFSIGKQRDQVNAEWMSRPVDSFKNKSTNQPLALVLISMAQSPIFAYRLKKETFEWPNFRGSLHEVILDKENNRKYSQNKFFGVLIALSLSFVLASSLLPFFQSFSPLHLIILITSFLGATVGYLLVAKDLGVKYTSVESFCNTGRNINCDKILNSEKAKIFGFIKFSDVVLTYFAFQILSLSSSFYIPSIASSILFILLSISLLTIPIIIFSVHYQYYKAKVWCKLCLVVNAILLFQTPLFYLVTSNLKLNDVTIFVTLVYFFIFLTMGSIIILFKELINRANEAENLTLKASRIKNSVSVFTHLLSQQRKVDYTLSDIEMSIGNPKSPIHIMMVSNLYCNPCKEQHSKMSELLANYPKKVHVTIRFLLSGKDMNKTLTTNQYLIQYWKENITRGHIDSDYTEKIIHDWFDVMDLEKFKINHKILGEIDTETKKIERLHFDWIESNQIDSTPAFFLNGYELPRNYSLQDLHTLIPALAAHYGKIKSTDNKLKMVHV